MARVARLQELHAEIDPAKPALIGVSGGRDSIALLHLLAHAGWKRLIVAHLNHRLRGRAAQADAAFVRSLAKSLGMRCEIGNVEVKKLAAREKISLETAARQARHDFFSRLAKSHRCRVVFLAHHAEDQAETVLLNLFRGAALRGVSGMAFATPLGKSLLLVRPALESPRSDIDAYMAAHQLRHREDASNNALEFTRNRLRHELLPLLNAIFRREVAPLVTRFAGQARQEDEFAQSIVDELVRKKKLLREDGTLHLTPSLRRLHPALLSRLLRDWLTGQCQGIGHREIQSALALLDATPPASFNLPGDGHLHWDGRRLWLAFPVRKRASRKSKSALLSKRR